VHRPLGEQGEDGRTDVAAASAGAASTSTVAGSPTAAEFGAAVETRIPAGLGISVLVSAMHL
jgi:hypothetical protein